MTTASDDPRPRRRPWRLGTPVVLVACGALFVASGYSSEGVPLRPSGTTDLADLVASESNRVERLEARAARLTEEVNVLSASVDDRSVQETQARAERLRDPAGFEPVTGEGLEVTLYDAPLEVREDSDIDINLLVVHQQDIQAVVNEMWQAGAEAVTIQGQRVISTTGIKCAGPTVELHGIPYSQPFVIRAIGDPDELEQQIDSSSYLSVYRAQAADPNIQIGWEMEQVDTFTAPAYEGISTLEHARPLT